MIAVKVIDPVTTEWAAPIVFAPRKDDSLQFCVDYRKLDAVTIRDSYRHPRMDKCIERLREATVFDTLYDNLGY